MNPFVTMERQILVALVDLTGESGPPPEVPQDVPGGRNRNGPLTSDGNNHGFSGII